jgi:stress response protein YsnF
VARNFRAETFLLRERPDVFAGFSPSFTDPCRFSHRQASVILPIVQAPQRPEVFPQQFEQELKGKIVMRKTLIIKPAILACSAGLLLTACHTERAEQHHHARYSSTSQDQSWMEGSGAQNSAYSSQSQDQDYSSGQSYSSTSQDYNSGSQASAQSQSSQSGQNEIVIPLHEEQVNVGKRTVDAGQVTIRKIIKTETVNQPIELRHETLVIDREGAGAEARSSASSSQSSAQLNAQSTAKTDSNWQKGAFNESQDLANAQPDNRDQSSSQATDEQSQASTQESSANEPAGANYQQSQQASSNSDLNNGSAFQEQTYTIQLKKEVPIINKSVVQTGQVVARKNSQMQQQTIQQQVRKEDVQLDKSGAAAQNVQIRGDFNTAGRDISEPSGAERQDNLQNKSSQQSTSDGATESIQHDSSGAQKIDSSVDESTDSTTRNRAPTKGQGAQDLKKGVDEEQP